MCIIYTGDYDINLTQLLCRECQQIIEIPKELVNLPTLWKIAEYYTKKKYSPENILKYIKLD
jgi:hypothetical protein